MFNFLMGCGIIIITEVRMSQCRYHGFCIPIGLVDNLETMHHMIKNIVKVFIF